MFASLRLRQANLATIVEWIEIHFDIYITITIILTITVTITNVHPKVSFYSEEHTLTGLYCGRQYHMVMHQVKFTNHGQDRAHLN